MKLRIRYRESVKANTLAKEIVIEDVFSIKKIDRHAIKVAYKENEMIVTGYYGVGQGECCVGYDIIRTAEEHLQLEEKQKAKEVK